MEAKKVEGGRGINLPDEWIPAIRAYALEHYNVGGWDVLVECWEDGDIFDVVKDCKTLQGAIRACGKILRVHDGVRRDIQGEVF